MSPFKCHLIYSSSAPPDHCLQDRNSAPWWFRTSSNWRMDPSLGFWVSEESSWPGLVLHWGQMGLELPTGPQGCWKGSPTFHPVNIYKHLEWGSASTKNRTLFWKNIFYCCALLWSMESWKLCLPDKVLRRSQLESIHPSTRRVVGEAAALLQWRDQLLYMEFDPLPSGEGCKVPVVRTEGCVPAISWSIAPHLHRLYFSWSFCWTSVRRFVRRL